MELLWLWPLSAALGFPLYKRQTAKINIIFFHSNRISNSAQYGPEGIPSIKIMKGSIISPNQPLVAKGDEAVLTLEVSHLSKMSLSPKLNLLSQMILLINSVNSSIVWRNSCSALFLLCAIIVRTPPRPGLPPVQDSRGEGPELVRGSTEAGERAEPCVP